MNILAIDTSTSLASIAVAVNGTLVAETLFSTDRTISARLLPEIERMLTFAGIGTGAIDLFGCAVGPGSFTGVRAGVATIQGLALATGKPCIGFSSLAMLAMNIPFASQPVCPLLDARKHEVYAGLYDCASPLPRAIRPDSVVAPELLAEQLREITDQPVLFTGDGATRYHDLLAAALGDRARFAPPGCMSGRAANGILLAEEGLRAGQDTSPSRLLPVYIRPSEAELARQPGI